MSSLARGARGSPAPCSIPSPPSQGVPPSPHILGPTRVAQGCHQDWGIPSQAAVSDWVGGGGSLPDTPVAGGTSTLSTAWSPPEPDQGQGGTQEQGLGRLGGSVTPDGARGPGGSMSPDSTAGAGDSKPPWCMGTWGGSVSPDSRAGEGAYQDRGGSTSPHGARGPGAQ